ncbi:MAG: hypothetical protein KKC79_02815 [Gammaproteobacteria bacterium]|nr:hypothetical protein [Gammaproteobacteria bacterium]MBU1443839.1 hypothetical protein [Gammaproteobacteria bacterium]MBU2286496.1 hypothetical protein [Gammaproteobacteria bacterium]MBU2407562.1 hypothetical protein [Gammaproteobacteria bacterium]
MALLVGVMNTRAASPKSLPQEEHVQLVKRIQRDTRRTEFHGRADRGAEHPRGNDDDDPRTDFYVNDLAVGALLAVLPPDATPIKGMPAIEDFNFLPDMGRMTGRLPLAGTTTFSWGRMLAVRGPQRSTVWLSQPS